MKFLITVCCTFLFITAYPQSINELLSFKEILPPGWMVSIDSVKQKKDNPLWKYNILFINPSIEGTITYGTVKRQQRIEHPQRGIYVYDIKYKTQLLESDYYFRFLNSYQSKGKRYAETKDYYIAFNFGIIENISEECKKETENLDHILISFFENLDK
jgi:hypothetical protein